MSIRAEPAPVDDRGGCAALDEAEIDEADAEAFAAVAFARFAAAFCVKKRATAWNAGPNEAQCWSRGWIHPGSCCHTDGFEYLPEQRSKQIQRTGALTDPAASSYR